VSDPSPRPSPSGDYVDLWTLPLDRSRVELASLERVLSPHERQRVARLRMPQDRARLIARRGLLRGLLAEYLGVPPAAIRLRTGSTGKPELHPAHCADGLTFNVTRSGALALCAVAWGRPVGVDLEMSSHAKYLEGAATDVLAPVERHAWRELPPAQRPRTLLAAFCAKEALLKARGEGLRRPLPEIALRFANGSPCAVRHIVGERAAATQWRIRALDLGPAHVGALATAGGAVRIRRRALT
jgi:4'-phosphopantetheinyl transferase